MCRKRLRSTWLTFLGLIYILGSTDCYLTDEYEEDNSVGNKNYPQYQLEEEEDENEYRDTDFYDPIFANKRNPAFTPYISVGALSNIQQFFENLKENFKSLESFPLDERKAFFGKQDQSTEPEIHQRIYRPPATAAFLHAVRNQRPSHKFKNFASKVDPSKAFQVSNHYGPALFRSRSGRSER